MATKSLVLGTANFGNSYGIASANRGSPRLDKNSSRNLYELALELGINCFDTANNYGESLQWLSEFSKQDEVKINSKISIHGRSHEAIAEEIQSQVALFESHAFSCLNLMQIHNWTGNHEEMQALQWIRSKTFYNWDPKLGATTYGPLAAISGLEEFDDLQIEWNILNQASYFSIAEYLNANRDTRKNISIRSILLQGLLTLEINQIPIKLKALIPIISKLNGIIAESSLPRTEFIIRSFHSLEFVDTLVIGVDNPSQLREIHKYFEEGPLEIGLHERIKDFEFSNLSLVDPRNW
jgi:aryl-alcohol dehydrogenase-like predicted oxidoreductase